MLVSKLVCLDNCVYSSQTETHTRLRNVEQGLAQTNTIVAKIKTVVETTEETVNNLDAGLTEVVKDHRERLEAREEELTFTQLNGSSALFVLSTNEKVARTGLGRLRH